MPRAPRFWGPRVYSLLFFPNFFIPCFSARSKQCAKCGALKSPSPPENARAPKFKKRGPIKLGPNVFCSLFQCFSAGPQRAQGPQKTSGPKIQKSRSQIAGPETVFLFPVSAQDPNSAGPQRVQGP